MGKASTEFERLTARTAYTRWVNATRMGMAIAAEDDLADAGRHAVMMGEVKEAAQDFIEALTTIFENGHGEALTVADVCEYAPHLSEVTTDELLEDLMNR